MSARLAAALVLILVVGCGGGGRGAANSSASGPPVQERSVSFRTSDGLVLTGRLFGTGRVGIVLAHMIPADASSWYATARTLARDGYLALAFNFRGYDGSKGTKSTANAPIDLKAARDLLVQSGARTYALVGASTGGTAALVAASKLDPLALVVISPPLRFSGLDAVIAAGRLQRPVLLMASKDDQPAMQSLETLSRALPNPDTKVFDGSAHGTNLLVGHPEAVDALVTFLERYAPSTQTTPTP
jgi:pimeloyl-ACP methyl ester carboxylesterase